MCYLGVFIAMGMSSVINIGFLAIQNVLVPAILMICAFIFYACIAPLLSSFLSFRGLALAFSLSGIVSIIAEMLILRKRLGGIDGQNIATSFLKTGACSLVMGMVALLVFNILPVFSFAGQNFALAMRLGIAVLIGFAAFNSIGFILRLQELSLIYDVVALRLRMFLKKK
jgi:putative peptidoglycan lipid II flippase